MTNGRNSNSKLVLTSLPNYIEFLLRQSITTCIKRIVYIRQMDYNSGSFLKISIREWKANQSNSFKSFVNL